MEQTPRQSFRQEVRAQLQQFDQTLITMQQSLEQLHADVVAFRSDVETRLRALEDKATHANAENPR